MKYSLLIEDVTLPELHAMLGVFLEATRSPRQATEKDKVISHPGERSCQERSHSESCAYCKDIEAYIRDCLRHNLDYADILFSLKQLKGRSMSPAELAGYLEEMP